MGIYSSCKALVIGVGRYADPQYDLNYARSDAEALAEMLGSEFGFDHIWTLYDKDATRQNIIRLFEQDLQRWMLGTKQITLDRVNRINKIIKTKKFSQSLFKKV